MDQDFLDLSVASVAHDLRHGLGQLLGMGDPARSPALTWAAIEHQLHIQATHSGNLPEHAGLELASHIPRLLPAGSGIEGEDEPTACVPAGCSELPYLGEKSVRFSRRRAAQ